LLPNKIDQWLYMFQYVRFEHLFCVNDVVKIWMWLTLLIIFLCVDLYLYVSKIFFMWIRLALHLGTVPITTKVVSSNPLHGEMHTIQHYVIKFVSDLRQVDDFLRVLRFPPPIKLIIDQGYKTIYDNNYIFIVVLWQVTSGLS
jgi:hypothetical protein